VTRRVLLLAVAVAVVSLPGRRTMPVMADVPHPQTLTALVAPNSLTRDTNADGLAHSVAARVIVPSTATLADLEAATNLAARLGYETTALTLPLVVHDSEITQSASIGVPIFVGRDNRFVRALANARTIDLASLKPGQGLVAAVGRGFDARCGVAHDPSHSAGDAGQSAGATDADDVDDRQRRWRKVAAPAARAIELWRINA
jgi:hypothetical protein